MPEPLTSSLSVKWQPALYIRGGRFSYHDHGLDWELSEKNGFFSPFAYQA